MSGKQQLAQLVDNLPESDSLEEAFARLYQAFKAKLRREAQAGGSEPRRQPMEDLVGYETSMTNYLQRGPVQLKPVGSRYPRREELHDRDLLR